MEFCKELVKTVFFNLDQSCYTHVYTHTGPLLSTSSLHLPPTLLDIKRMRDVNRTKRAQATVKCLEFHPTASVALTAGWHKTLDLFQVDGEVNPKLQSVHVQDFPISTAHFTRDGTEVVMAGERKSYYVYDMMAGKVTRVYGIRGKDVSLCSYLPPSCSSSLPSLPSSILSPLSAYNSLQGEEKDGTTSLSFHQITSFLPSWEKTVTFSLSQIRCGYIWHHS